MVAQAFDQDILSGGAPAFKLRYYQVAAVGRVLGAISRGQRRVLALIAAGAGTTITAATIIAKLAAYQAHTGQAARGALYLDDRPVAELTARTLAPLRRLARQDAGLTIGSLGDRFETLDPASISLVVVNLTHGGQADDPSLWRDVLERLPDACQVGLTGSAPDEAAAIYRYFGRPIYRYAGDQARADGYLAAVPASVPDPADSAPAEIDLEALLGPSPGDCFVGGVGGVGGVGDGDGGGDLGSRPTRALQDPVTIAVEIRRSLEYTELATEQSALAARLVSLLRLADRPGPVGRAAARRADELTELEILAELEDQVGGAEAIRRHINLLKELLATS
jgi:hypothetical protein